MSFLIWRSRTSILRCFVFSDTLRVDFGIVAPAVGNFAPHVRKRRTKMRNRNAGFCKLGHNGRWGAAPGAGSAAATACSALLAVRTRVLGLSAARQHQSLRASQRAACREARASFRGCPAHAHTVGIRACACRGRSVPGAPRLPLTVRGWRREKNLEDALTEVDEAAVQAAAQQQPGGGIFSKPRSFYPNDGCYDKPGEEKKERPAVVAGIPVSGRAWKADCKRSSSIINKPKLMRKSWDEKMAAKKVQQTIKAKENALKQARIDEKRDKRAKQAERQAQKEANMLKGAVVQAISTKTVKKMSRKQLRDVRKMDVHSEINPAPIKKTKGLNGRVLV